jgi:RecB family endonuclease NucS
MLGKHSLSASTRATNKAKHLAIVIIKVKRQRPNPRPVRQLKCFFSFAAEVFTPII